MLFRSRPTNNAGTNNAGLAGCGAHLSDPVSGPRKGNGPEINKATSRGSRLVAQGSTRLGPPPIYAHVDYPNVFGKSGHTPKIGSNPWDSRDLLTEIMPADRSPHPAEKPAPSDDYALQGGDADRVDHVARVQAPQDFGDVAFHRLFLAGHQVGDVLVRQALGAHQQHA